MKHIRVAKGWGGEIWFANNEKYCGKELFVLDGLYSSEGDFHFHKIKDETFYIMEGTLLLDFFMPGEPMKSIQLAEGASFRVPPEMRHRFCGWEGDCRFIEVSTHHEDSDSYYEGRN